MEVIFIRLGKAWNMVKREGLINGGKIIFTAIFALFRKVKPGDVLIITAGVGASANYRARKHAEELNFQGIRTSVAIQDSPFLLKYIDKFKVFVFHRNLVTPKIKEIVKKIKEQRKEMIFETDDLIFDEKYFEQMDYQKNINKLEGKMYENGGVGKEIVDDPYTKVCTTTTSYLARELRKRGKKVFIVRNKIAQEEIAWSKEFLKDRKNKENELIKIGYFSGTISHNKDFTTVIEPLKMVLRRYRNVRLVLVGPLEVKNEFVKEFENQIENLPFAPLKEHFRNISKVDINIVPLELNKPFCEAKSENKFIEAGVVQVPTVAVRNQTYVEAIEDGVDGFLADSNEEWVEKLGKLVENKELREEIGENAREKVLEKYNTKNVDNEEYYNYLKVKISRDD